MQDHVRKGYIGRYKLIGLLATGGMAEIYLALSGELSGFHTLVVVKRILPHLASDSHFIEMFFDEARIVARLDHPNIVRILEVGHDGDEYFLVMEVVQGKPLSALLRKGVKRERPLSHAQSAFLVAQAANGLAYAHDVADTDGHSLSLVHRDVSPQNILVSFEGAVKLIDFGVARALGRLTQTSPGGLKGKIWYMAPEQASGGQVDRRSDVFALGVVLWESLCGRRLFRRETELATLRAIVDEPIPAPSKVIRISPRLDRIVMQALEKDPANRFQAAHEMALALERHAFASEGFSPTQISAAMKSLFESDHARWKKTVAAAMDPGGPEAGSPEDLGTILTPHGTDLSTRGPTVALHPGLGQSTARLTSAVLDVSSDARSMPSADFTLPNAPRRLDRRWIAAAAAVGGFAIAVAAVLLAGPGTSAVTVIRSSGGQTVESIPPTASSRPDPTAASPIPPLLASAERGVEIPPASPAGADMAEVVSPQSSPSVIASRGGMPARKNDARRGARSAMSDAGKSSKNRSSVPADGTAECAVAIGTQPWSEVWIDGKNTRMHTPYTENLTCGRHKLTLKRWELDLAKTVTITLRRGETFKRSFTLQ